MSNTEIDSVAEKLAGAKVDEEKEVSFAGKGLKMDTESEAEEVVKAIKACPNMTTLRLEGNTLGVNAAKAIAKALESQRNLKRALWKDMFTRRTEKEIPEVLSYLGSGLMLSKAKLVELDLSDNAFGPRGLRGIVIFLKSPVCYTLCELRLTNNGLGVMGGKMLAEALLACHSNSVKDGFPLSLKVFTCGRNRLENEGAKALSDVFKAIRTLETVAMPQNGICAEGVSALVEALATNPDLKDLNLEDNSFTEEGAQAVAKHLASFEKLEVIHFGDCLLRTEGAYLLAEALKDSCPLLRELRLGYNEIGRDAGIAISEAMENKHNLEVLDLNGNQFGVEGCRIIEGTLEVIGKLDKLGSLSEDEGAEDDEEEDYNEDEEADKDGDGDSIENREEDKENRDVNVSFIQSSPVKITATDFLANPSSSKLLQLGKNRVTLISKELGEKPSIDQCMDAFAKVSSCISDCDDEEVKTAVHECVDAIFSTAFATAEESSSISLLNNTLLVYLGLIKCEDKDFKPISNLTGPFQSLKHAVGQSYFSHSTRDVLQLFLSMPSIHTGLAYEISGIIAAL